jgi:hypothetical protein
MEPCRKLFNLPLIKQKVKRDCFEITQPTNREDYFTTPFGTRNVGDLSRVRFYHLSGRRIKAFFIKYNYVSLTYAISVYFPKQFYRNVSLFTIKRTLEKTIRKLLLRIGDVIVEITPTDNSQN